ncbi:MAG: DUF5702 domain-containing protein [Lachnospiraceae bacterium]|nr:DUF5702 domain-containing protein [Lachnospiraceae bacterium]
MWFSRRTKGAISIFLVLILVPMLTISSLFVDASRVRLGKGVVESAGDLALNTALTNYDTQLKDLYGIFATSQTIDEMNIQLEDYFRTSMISSGVARTDADNYVDAIMTQLGLLGEDDNTADLLNIDLVDFDVSLRTDYSLVNASLLEKEIVDFMKYRAPINTGLGFLESLNSFTKLQQQTKLVDDRKEYYEAEKSVMENLKSAWDQINNYNKLPFVSDDQYFPGMQNYFKETGNKETDLKLRYVYFNRDTIRDLYQTAPYVIYDAGIVYVEDQPLAHPEAGLYSDTVNVWKMHDTATGMAADFDNFANQPTYGEGHLPTPAEVESQIKSFYTTLNRLDAAVADYEAFEIPAVPYHLQALVQLMRSERLTYMTNQADTLYMQFQKLKSAMIWAYGYEKQEDRAAVLNQTIETNVLDFGAKAKTSKITKTAEAHFVHIEAQFEAAMEYLQKVMELYTQYSYDERGKTDPSSVNSGVEEIGKKVAGYVKDLEDGAEYLEKASGFIQTAVASVENADTPGSLANARQKWNTDANSSELQNTSIARQDQAELRELGTYLNPQDMHKMIDRLNNVAANLRATAQQVRMYQFDGTFIGDIQGFDKLCQVLEAKLTDYALLHVPIGDAELDKYVGDNFFWQAGSIDVSWINQSGTQVKLHGTGTDKLNLYSYMYSHFNSGEVSNSSEPKTEDKKNGEDTYNNIKSQSSSASSEAANGGGSGLNTGNELCNIENKPSNYAGSDKKTEAAEIATGDDAASKTSGDLGKMFAQLASSLAGMGTDLRDKLYVSDYILSMFSYDTIEAELAIENQGRPADKQKTLQTLTLNPIDAEHNFAYGREVEYIIYGGTNGSNITKAYGSIYGIRLAFNLIYAFSNSEIRETAFALATPISAATLGIIPVPLIQAVIILGISCAESAIDLVEIKEGKKVQLIKDSQTWHISINGLVNAAKDGAKWVAQKAADKAFETADQKLDELLNKTDEELEAMIAGGTEEITKTVSDSFDELITKNANLAIQKLQTLANNAIEKYYSDPALNMVDYVGSELDNWLADEAARVGTDDLGYVIEREAVKLIKAKYIEPVIKAIQDSAADIQKRAENMGTQLLAEITKIKGEIVAQINSGCAEIQSYRAQMMEKVSNAAHEGVQSLRDTVNSQINGMFGDTSFEKNEGSGVASMIAFGYSDYLRLFLMIGLYTNEEGVLLRTADVIQKNIAMTTGNDSYKLEKAYVYVQINAEAQVKPTFLSLPLFGDTPGNPASDPTWYTIRYSDIRGY